MARGRRYVVGAGVMVLLALVAVAAAAGGGAAGGRGHPLHLPRFVVDGGTVVVTAALVFGGVLWAYQFALLLSAKAATPERPKRRWWAVPIVVLLLVALRFAAVAVLRIFGRKPGQAALPGPGRQVVAQALLGHGRHAPPPGITGADLLTGAVIGLLALLLALFLARRRGRPSLTGARTPSPPVAGPSEEAVLEPSAMVDDSMDALMAEPDPRRAVIAAYRSMERWLARAGLGREAWEAPFEHLGRVLVDLGATAPLARHLAGLFERAKYDRRPCGPDMKAEALDALVHLREGFLPGPSDRPEPVLPEAGRTAAAQAPAAQAPVGGGPSAGTR